MSELQVGAEKVELPSGCASFGLFFVLIFLGAACGSGMFTVLSDPSRGNLAWFGAGVACWLGLFAVFANEIRGGR